MKKRIAFALAGLALLTAMPAASQQDPLLDQQIRTSLDVVRYDLVDFDLPGSPAEPFTVPVTLGDRAVTLTMAPWSLRSSNFRVLVDDGSGELREFPAPAPRTVRGQAAEVVGSSVAGSLLEDGLKIKIVLPTKNGAEVWGIQPLSQVVDGQPLTRHVVYRAEDTVAPMEYHCGVTEHVPDPGDVMTPRVDIFKECEIAIDADFQLYQLNGNSEANTIADVENVMAGVTNTYQLDVDITYRITLLIVRTSSASNPYTTNNASSLLQQFQNWWNANQASQQRDVAHLFTGRTISGSTIGIAYLGVICNRPSAYGLSQTRFSGSYVLRVTLTAHELGHNWNAGHCDSTSNCKIMCSAINACTSVGNPPRFGPTAINQIVAHRNTRNCLTDVVVGLIDLPFSDTFPSGTFNSIHWPVVGGATITQGINPPSPNLVAQFDNMDFLESGEIRLGNAGGPVRVSFFASRIGVPQGKSFIVEFTDAQNNWIEVGRLTSDGETDLNYIQHTFFLPSNVLFDGSRARMRTDNGSGTAFWLIDNFLVDVAPGYPIPFTETFPNSTLDTGFWPIATGTVFVTTNATNEPSPPYSLSMNRVSRLESAALLAAGKAGMGYELSFYMQERDLEPGDNLVILFRDSGGTYQPLGAIISQGGTQTTFTRHAYPLPAAAFHDGLRIAFQGGADALNDVWFLDDISISIAPPPACPADLSGSADPSDPAYGVPDGNVDAADFFFFLDQFISGNLAVADLTGSADPSDPSYGIPDGNVDAADFFYYLDIFVAGCP
ncbi:MAG: hypothetical protein KIT24_08710 [Phycisphaeraceae bacterium]|nr:hypothetical protein [Phycisphaeraceae bacterium]